MPFRQRGSQEFNATPTIIIPAKATPTSGTPRAPAPTINHSP